MSMLRSKLLRRLAGVGGMTSVLMLLVASSALAQDIRITSPADGTEVREGGGVLVSGEGCKPGSTVVFAYEDPGPTTTARQDGTFAARVPVPEIEVPAGNVEVTLTATCNNSQDTVRLVVVDDEDDLEIIEPPSQAGVKPGQTFTVRGEGCEPGSTVTVSFLGRKTTTAANNEGSFARSVTVPRDVKVPRDVEEAGEVSLAVTCGSQWDAVVLVLDVDRKPPPSSRQVREVPTGGVATGGGGTAEGPPATLLAIGGLAAVGMTGVLVKRRFAAKR